MITEAKWPSVTRVLKEANDLGLLQMHDDLGPIKCQAIMEEASAIGDEAHQIIEGYAKKQLPLLNPYAAGHPKARVALHSYRLYDEKYHPVYLENELTCRSKRHQFVCRFDSLQYVAFPEYADILGVDPLLAMVDYKTSSEIKEVYVLQLAANAEAFFEERGRYPDVGLVIQMSKRLQAPPMATIYVYQHLRRYFKPFKDLLGFWRWRHGYGGWKGSANDVIIDTILNEEERP